jgi:Fe-S-cluster-containing dehydrogenase component
MWPSVQVGRHKKFERFRRDRCFGCSSCVNLANRWPNEQREKEKVLLSLRQTGELSSRLATLEHSADPICSSCLVWQ